jgi:hypothetical protein
MSNLLLMTTLRQQELVTIRRVVDLYVDHDLPRFGRGKCVPQVACYVQSSINVSIGFLLDTSRSGCR